jgi:cell wall-associated NlpC family hydrolase
MMFTIRYIVVIGFCALLQACSDNVDTKDSIKTEITEVENVDENDFNDPPLQDLGDSIVLYATSFLGTPYKEAGKDASGFDCSGFVSYVFKNYAIDIPPSSRHMATLGKEILVEDARQGDLIFFRGTDSTSKEVGHVGIIVSKPGEPVKFIHSSSAKSSPCVKFDSLIKPNYQRRFMVVKRVLEN